MSISVHVTSEGQCHTIEFKETCLETKCVFHLRNNIPPVKCTIDGYFLYCRFQLSELQISSLFGGVNPRIRRLKAHNLTEFPHSLLTNNGSLCLVSDSQVNCFSLQRPFKIPTISISQTTSPSLAKKQDLVSEEILDWQANRQQEMRYQSRVHHFQNDEFSDEETLLQYVEMLSLEQAQ